MNRSRRRKGPAPHLVAAMASILLLVVGLAVTAYFVVLRGAGVQAELQGARGPELALLIGCVVGLAFVTHLTVLHAARQAAGGSRERQLLHRALEIDYSDPEALSEFETVPELRDLVSLLMAEKTQVREFGDRVESLRGEMDSLVDGMRRSAQDGGRIRAEGLSDLGLRVAEIWNGFVARRTNADTAPVERQPASRAQELAPLVARLDELETELERLQAVIATRTVLEARTPAAAPEAEPQPEEFEIAATVAASPMATDPRAAIAAEGAATAAVRRADPWTTVRSTASLPVGIDADWGTGPAVAPQRRAGTANPPEVARPETTPQRMRWTGAGVPAAGAAPDVMASNAPLEDDIPFPHFVGKPVRPISDRVEVTYEGQDGEEVVDLPASALLFESEDEEPRRDTSSQEEEVFDLRSLGAREYES